jgi:hypothetical protein
MGTGAELVRFEAGQNPAFYDWLERNRGGFFLSDPRVEARGAVFLHCSPCSHYVQTPGTDSTTVPKLCSRSREALETWAAANLDRKVRVCSTCL